MAATFTWTFSSLDIASTEDGLTDVIKTIHWRYKCSEDTYTSEFYGALALESPDPLYYIQYNDITKEDLVAWLENKLNMSEMHEGLLAAIENLKNPPMVTRIPNF